jgi:DUF971 family protein
VNRKLSIPILGQGDPNRPQDVHLVGRYALGVDWTDGHGSIFPFEHLRRACPCGACAGLEAPPAAATWPQDIKKLDTALRIRWTDGHESVLPYAELRAGCRCAACTGVHG